MERSNDMLQQVDDLYDKLQGTKNGGRRGRGRSEDAISPIEMLQSLQQLVDEHGAMEQESLAKDEELSRLRQQLAEARERQVRPTDAKQCSNIFTRGYLTSAACRLCWSRRSISSCCSKISTLQRWPHIFSIQWFPCLTNFVTWCPGYVA